MLRKSDCLLSRNFVQLQIFCFLAHNSQLCLIYVLHNSGDLSYKILIVAKRVYIESKVYARVCDKSCIEAKFV